jgi:predicted secreted protein
MAGKIAPYREKINKSRIKKFAKECDVVKKNAAKAIIVGMLSIVLAITTGMVATAAETSIDDLPIATTVEVVGGSGEPGAATISMPSGAYFVISLYAAGGTGYNWTLDNEKLTMTEMITTTTEAVSSEPLAGGPTRWKFCLRVNSETTGQETLHFNLARPWMKNEKPAKTFDLTVIAK